MKTASQISEHRLYTTLPDSEIRLMCSYATRLPGFLDILLSKCIMSSAEAHLLLGMVSTHRGDSMSGGVVGRFTQNDYISFSTGFVSTKYSDPELKRFGLDEYVGGVGVFVPLEKILQYKSISFSHCSQKGGIKNYDLNKDNITAAVHQTRKEGELFDDGYGNLFEVSIDTGYKYPRLPIDENVVIAIPIGMKDEISELLFERRQMYIDLYEEIKDRDPEELRFTEIDGRDFGHNPAAIQSFIPNMLGEINLDAMPIYWYTEKNLNDALKRVSCRNNLIKI